MAPPKNSIFVFLIIIVAILLATIIFFKYFITETTSLVKGQVVAVDGNTITIDGVIEVKLDGQKTLSEAKKVSLRITPKTQFVKTVYLMNVVGKKNGDIFNPEKSQELGTLSDIVRGVGISEARVRGNLLKVNSATAISINYDIISFQK